MTSAGDAAVEVRALAKRYAGGVVALQGVDLTVARGTITAIIGANGSGKSTLLQILGGITSPDAGTVRVLGLNPTARSAALRERIAYVAQMVELDPEMTGLETLRLFATFHGITSRDIASRVDALADTFGLQPYLARLVGSYSGGMRQRLHLAIAFVHKPDLILMDEPTAALDPLGRADIWQLLQACRDRGQTVVSITHDINEVARYCDAIVLLHDGHVVAFGSPQTLVAQDPIWTLEVTLDRRVMDEAALLARIDVPTVGPPRLIGSHLSLRFHGIDAPSALQAKRVLFDRLSEAGETVLGFRLDPPDLSSVYFKLTGAPIESPDTTSPRQQQVAKGQRRAA